MSEAVVDSMKKVELNLTVHEEDGRENPGNRFSFIVGLGSEGFTPFEKEIAGLKVGDSLRIQPSASALPAYFGASYLPLCQALNTSVFGAPLLLTVEVLAISEPESREVVEQLAKSAGHCSCGGSCGCS